MSANSEELEEETLEEIAKHLVNVSSYIFRYLSKNEPGMRKSDVLTQIIYSLYNQHDKAINIQNNYCKRTSGGD